MTLRGPSEFHSPYQAFSNHSNAFFFSVAKLPQHYSQSPGCLFLRSTAGILQTATLIGTEIVCFVAGRVCLFSIFKPGPSACDRKMSVSTLPPYQDLHVLSGAERAVIFDLLFEPSEALHTLVSKAMQGDSYNDLIANVGTQLRKAADLTGAGDLVWLESILASHPRLGEKKVESEQSRAEQAQLQSDTGADQEMLRRLNDLYEDTFPGLRYM